MRYIVRIANKDLDGNLPIHRALMGLKGISHRTARTMAYGFEKETGIAFDTKLGSIPEEADARLEEQVVSPLKKGMPAWMLNRRRDLETGEDKHLIMSDLDFSKRRDLQRLNEIKSYRGLRHSWGLPVRGQKTKSSFRKGGAVGVTKKGIQQAKGGKK